MLVACLLSGIRFNPHTHAGCDYIGGWSNVININVSIHTPTQGVTRIMFIIKTGIEYVSIHTPTQGVTKPRSRASLGFFVSIHTPTQGVTYCRDMIKHKRLFQSTHPRRV